MESKTTIFKGLVYLYIFVCWIINAFQLFGCDFASPYKEEVIHFVGLIMPPLSGITVWF